MENKSDINDNKNKMPNYDKNDIEKCMENFKIIIENSNDLPNLSENIIELAINGGLGENCLRGVAWKILLKYYSIDPESSIKTWIDQTKDKRKLYHKKLKELTSLNKFSGDPLGANSQNNEWNSFFEDSDIKKLITLDVNRTYQDKDLFCNSKIKEIEINVLTIWAKENKIPGYKQGINEILAMLIYSFYPYYTESPIKKYTDDYLNNLSIDPEENYKELYYYFFDEKELESDLFFLLTNIMNEGVKNFFLDKQKNQTESYLVKRCNNIIHRKLRLQDNRLYNHFINIELDAEFVIQRWLKCLFDREFHPKNVELFWDALLSDEFKFQTHDFNFADYLCLAMIIFIRDELVIKNQSESFQRLFKYPPIESPTPLINLAFNLRSEVLTKEHEEDIKIKEKEEEKKKMMDKMKEIEKINQNLIKMKNMNNEDSLDYLAEKKKKFYTPTLEKSNEIKFTNDNSNKINTNIIKDEGKKISKEIKPEIKKSITQEIKEDGINKNNNNQVKKSNSNINMDEISLQNKNILKELRRIYIKYSNKIEKSDKEKMNGLFDILEKNI